MTAVKLKGARFTPLWSGNRLSKIYRSFENTGSIGESWETSIEEEEDAGATVCLDGCEISFREYILQKGLIDPPLVKLLDSEAPLSIQVHPDDVAAKLLGGRSKSEIWYVLAAEKGAEILYGTKDGVTLSEIKDVITNGTVESLLCRVSVQSGDVFMIPPGLVHSLGAGITVLEVQDKAGTTYRVKDIAGNRETHIRESLESVKIYSAEQIEEYRFSKNNTNEAELPGTMIARTEGYTVSKYSSSDSDSTITLPDGGVYIFCESGSGFSENLQFETGDSVFFPACREITLSPYSSVILVTL